MLIQEDPHDPQIDELVDQALKATAQALYSHAQGDGVARALLYLFTRVANTWRSIRTLYEALKSNFPETSMVDAGTLVRAMYEAHLQAAFVAHDRNKQQERAKLYLEYEHVERYLLVPKVFRHKTVFRKRLEESPRREEAAPGVKAEYDRVMKDYCTRKRRKPRDRWYPGTLRDLAQHIGNEAEYDFFVSLFHGCVHSSALAVRIGPPIKPEHITTIASIIACKTARTGLQYIREDIGEELQKVIDRFANTSIMDES